MLPGVYETIKDGGLGLISAANAGVFGIVGNASSGVAGQIYYLNDPATAEATFGYGTLLERILDAFANGATRILAIKADPTGGTAAANGSVTHQVSGTSSGTCTLTGTPKADRDCKVLITSGGATGAIGGGGVKIKISKNGGISYGDEITLPASSPQTIDLGQGTSVVLTDNATPAGSFVIDDYWTFGPREAKPTTGNALAAAEALAVNDEVNWVHVTDVTDNTFWASLSSFCATLLSQHRYIFFITEAAKPTSTTAAWVTSSVSAASAFFQERVMVWLGWGLLTDRHGDAMVRNGAGVIDGLLASAKVQESIGWVGGFPINNMLSHFPQNLTDAQIETLDQARYGTFRFWPGHGFRVTNGRLMASLTSDFRYVETLRVINKAVKLVRVAAIPFVQAVADAAGLIAFQKSLEAPLEQMKSDDEIDSFQILIPTGQNILSTGTVNVQLTIVSKGIMRIINLVFGLGQAKAA